MTHLEAEMGPLSEGKFYSLWELCREMVPLPQGVLQAEVGSPAERAGEGSILLGGSGSLSLLGGGVGCVPGDDSLSSGAPEC